MLPADSGSWHGEGSRREFKKVFGFSKALLAIHTLDDGFQHMYAPLKLVERFYSYLDELRSEGLKKLEDKFRKFYQIKKMARAEITKIALRDYSKLSNFALARKYEQIRTWIHRATIYDQFGWLSEDYWIEPMDEILVKSLKLKRGSKEYNTLLFSLTKPEEISTTLKEKRAVLRETLNVKRKESSVKKSVSKLTKQFGWMPVFTYGIPWDERHYESELKEQIKRSMTELQSEYEALVDYTKSRNEEIEKLANGYQIKSNDLQVFIDFGLILDARNEAEYVLSFGSFYLLQIYRETARRLALSIKQIRSLEETEIVACLRGEKKAHQLLEGRRRFFGWGFDKKMGKITFFDEDESEKLFAFVEKHAKGAVGNSTKAGITASPGKSKGVARIIVSPEDNHRVKKGDILITIATTVDYLPAMKRAAAFVTEVGGLTCHAAVVAREFGVPCIVSLKNATSDFRDGDRVEVDANKGIVRRISKRELKNS